MLGETPTQILARFALGYPGFSLDVDLDLPGQGVTAIFGPSGSGKTSLLRCMAGLTRAPTARCVVSGEIWHDETAGIFLPAHKRPVGVVFQDARLFTHLSVRGNLEFGMNRVPRSERSIGFDDAVALLGLRALLKRAPDHLSGGERQRAAIARALLVSPRLLLLDEPLAALDTLRKNEILPYLERLRDELSLPIFYVSHAADEVARLADHLVLLEAGRAAASGPLGETLARVDLLASFGDEAAVVIETRVAAHDADGLSRLDFAGGSIHVSRRGESLGAPLRCRILARDVSLALSAHADSSILNRFAATVSEVVATATPGHVVVQLEVGGLPLLARITERSRTQLVIRPGLKLWAQIKAVALLA